MRLGDLTSTKPKSMLDVNDRHLCDYFFDLVGEMSLDVVVTTKDTEKHRSSNKYFESQAKQYSGNVIIRPVNFLSQQAVKSVLGMRRFMRDNGYDSLVVCPNDLYYAGSIADLINFHYDHGSDLTFLAHPDPNPELATIDIESDNGRITSIRRAKPEDSVKPSIYVVSSSMLARPFNAVFNLSVDLLNFLLGRPIKRFFEKYGVYMLFDGDSTVFNVNTVEDYEDLCNFVESNSK